MELLKVICRSGVKSLAEFFREEIESILLPKKQNILWLECDSMQELEYRASRNKDAIVLLQEYERKDERGLAWELTEIRDAGNIRVVCSIRHFHYGTSFMAILYAAGIMDALFEEDTDAVHIAERLLAPRRREECRKYYGIHSIQEVMSVLEIMEQDTMERYIRYIGGSIDGEEMSERFHEVVKKLSYPEKCCFMEKIPEDMRNEIVEKNGLDKMVFYSRQR